MTTSSSQAEENTALQDELNRLRELVYAYPPSDFSPDGQTWKQVAELQASRLAESAAKGPFPPGKGTQPEQAPLAKGGKEATAQLCGATAPSTASPAAQGPLAADTERVIQWIRTGAKSAVLSFTDGPERQVAYAVEDDRRRRRGDAVIHPLAKDAKTVASHEFGLSPGLAVSVRVSREGESAVLSRLEAEEADPDAASQERMDNLVGAFREHLSRRDLRWLLERVVAEIEDRYAGLHRTPDLRAALERLGKLAGNRQPDAKAEPSTA